MAEFSKYQVSGVSHLLEHNNRLPDDGRDRSNENIDNELTMLNYHLKKGTMRDLARRLNNVFSIKRTDGVVLGEMIVTLPKNVKNTKETMMPFFQAVYDFYVEDFGEENIINAVVHRDEGRPHIHIDFVPVIKENINLNDGVKGSKLLKEWRQEHGNPEEVERLCCKDLINREYLNNMHPRLSQFVSDRLGYEVEILNGATINGNKKIEQLKLETLHDEVNVLQKKKDGLETEISQIHKIAKEWGINEYDIGLMPLMQRIDDLEKQNKVLRSIIERKGYTYSSDELRTISVKKFKPSKVAKISVMDGSLAQADIPQDAIVVIELPMESPKEEPKEEKSEDGQNNDERTERQNRFERYDRPSHMLNEASEARMPIEERMMMERSRMMPDERHYGMRDGMRERTPQRSGASVGKSPQQALIDREREINRYIRNATMVSKDVYVKEARMTNRRYVYLKTYKDKPDKVINAIIELEQTLREMNDLKERTIYIDRISGDKYDMARSALATLDTQTLYFTRRDLDEKTEEKNLQQTKE